MAVVPICRLHAGEARLRPEHRTPEVATVQAFCCLSARLHRLETSVEIFGQRDLKVSRPGDANAILFRLFAEVANRRMAVRGSCCNRPAIAGW